MFCKCDTWRIFYEKLGGRKWQVPIVTVFRRQILWQNHLRRKQKYTRLGGSDITSSVKNSRWNFNGKQKRAATSERTWKDPPLARSSIHAEKMEWHCNHVMHRVIPTAKTHMNESIASTPHIAKDPGIAAIKPLRCLQLQRGRARPHVTWHCLQEQQMTAEDRPPSRIPRDTGHRRPGAL